MKRITAISTIIIAVSLLVTSSCSSCSNGGRQVSETELDDSTKTALEMEGKRKEEPEYKIVTTHGTMKVRLYGKTPKHRDNFAKLVAERYYEGMRFHRVINGFMIQTGDPFSRDTALVDKWGMGGPDYTIPAEFVNEYWHKKGALAAARKGDIANPKKASSGSQFYIVQDENACLHLDGEYTVFGEVIEGLDVIDKIASVPTDVRDRPYEDVIIFFISPADAPAEEAADTTANAAQADSTAAEDIKPEE